MSSYGIMGGTFDPIHLGHLLIAERAREEFSLDEVVFVPSGAPAHKKSYQITNQELRWSMTCLAIDGNAAFSASRVELDRPGISYAVDTIAQLITERPDQKPFFITGMDAILEILTWHRASELPGMCEFVAATRPGYDLDEARSVLSGAFLERTHFMNVPLLEISSTHIRNRVAEGKSIRYMTPSSVHQFIVSNRLYREPDAAKVP